MKYLIGALYQLAGVAFMGMGILGLAASGVMLYHNHALIAVGLFVISILGFMGVEWLVSKHPIP